MTGTVKPFDTLTQQKLIRQMKELTPYAMAYLEACLKGVDKEGEAVSVSVDEKLWAAHFVLDRLMPIEDPGIPR